MSAHADRPPVSVVVPFGGRESEVPWTLAALARLRLRSDDELIVVDNSVEAVVRGVGGVTAVRAAWRRSSYYARNVGAEVARSDWLLFLDADCRPSPTLVDDYFDAPIAARCGALAGEIVALDDQGGLAVRYARARRSLDQAGFVGERARPFAATANVLVRRTAWSELGGFCEVRSGGDVDFSWRLAEAGWSLVLCRGARVEHRHRDRLPGLLRQRVHYGSGAAWMSRRYPGGRPPARAGRGLVRSAASAAIWVLRGEPGRAIFRAIDGLCFGAYLTGRMLGNGAGRAGAVQPTGASAVVVADRFPDPSGAAIAAAVDELRSGGRAVRVEARTRPLRLDRGLARDVSATYLEDDGVLVRAAELARLAATRPARVVAVLLEGGARPRWSLRALAPAARRLETGGERRVEGPEAEMSREAKRLRLLAGLATPDGPRAS